jgi:GTP-binding protein HflX
MHKIVSEKPLKAIIVGTKASEITLKELESLLKTLNIQTELVFIVNNRAHNPANYIGKGKLEELHGYVAESNIDIVAIDDELKYSQIRNLQNRLKTTVLDRPRIILEIFAKRATTKEGKLQVEIATIQRRKTELIKQNGNMDQQSGFIGGKGPGEKKIELSRRRLLQRLKALKLDLKKIEKQRNVTRGKRSSSSILTVSLVGYTNAGKSTLFNVLTKENLPTDNLLFHTLDTRTRKGYLNHTIGEILYNDTVGFLRKLPHELIAAFKSTLEEILLSDLVLIILDVSDPQFENHLVTVNKTLEELGASIIPSILVLNKSDELPEGFEYPHFEITPETPIVSISALKSNGIDNLKDQISSYFLTRIG